MALTLGITGMDSTGSMYPRFRYTPALAAAVTPIMKLLVVVDTLNGSRIARSIATTFSAPDPIPSKPESIPASPMIENPATTDCTLYSFMPSGVG